MDSLKTLSLQDTVIHDEITSNVTNETKIEKHFRFAELPDTIRKDIYELLLCNFRPAHELSWVTMEMLGVDCPSNPLVSLGTASTAILGVSRAIHDEAREVLRKKNRFIKVEANIPYQAIRKLLVPYMLPVLRLSASASANFKDAVLVHSISRDHQDEDVQGLHFIFLSRDLDRFLDMWQDARSLFMDHDTVVSYDVNFLGITEGDSTKEVVFNSTLQDTIMFAYGCVRNMTRVTISGVPAEVANKVKQRLSSSYPASSMVLMTELVGKVTEERSINWSQHDKSFRYAHLAKLSRDIQRAMAGSNGAKLREQLKSSGEWKHFVQSRYNTLKEQADILLEILISQEMNFSSIYKPLQCMIPELTVAISFLWKRANALLDFDSSSTWLPTQHQQVEFLCMRSEAFRVVGNAEYLFFAEFAVLQAQRILPLDVKVQREVALNAAWRKTIEEFSESSDEMAWKHKKTKKFRKGKKERKYQKRKN